METLTLINAFSKKSKNQKIQHIAQTTSDPARFAELVKSFWHSDPAIQGILDEISENTLTNFPFPYGVAPNFLINGQIFHIPMVVEESSVVAAAGNSAKFWSDKGGFRTRVISTKKSGQVHFLWNGNFDLLRPDLQGVIQLLKVTTRDLTRKMQARGGGISDIRLEKRPGVAQDYYCLDVDFETVDSMGANFINSCLEEMAQALQSYFSHHFPETRFETIMAILSNYNPDCLVECVVECAIEDLFPGSGSFSGDFARKFAMAVRIAEKDPFRAATHNKGIMNGIDAVVLATGNDFRAVEAGAHAFAARNGSYASLTRVDVSDGRFRYTLEIPLALGTVGGLTSLHPLARLSLEVLGNPSGPGLMQIAAAAGMANNFGALRALTTHGIQNGHMKIHLSNILNTFGASPAEKEMAGRFFVKQKVSYRAVEDFLKSLRHSND